MGKLTIILHSGDWWKVYHALSIASSAAVMGEEVIIFLTYWALQKFTRNAIESDICDDTEDEFIHSAMKRGLVRPIGEMANLSKQVGVKIFACSGSMSLFNLELDDLVDEVEGVMGMAEFLDKAENASILFI